MSDRTATVIGCTGLIGSHLVSLLLKDDDYENIRLLVRRPLSFTHPKVAVKLIDFSDYESFKLGIDGSDAVFCTIGTTQQKVGGNKEAYRKVDYDIAVRAARFCEETGCPNFVLVSSVGADANSTNFYLGLKGEIENAVKEKNIRSVSIIRPSLLLGNRREKRRGEKIGQVAMQAFSPLLMGKWQKYKPIHAEQVAGAMLAIAREEKIGVRIYEYKDLMRLQPGE